MSKSISVSAFTFPVCNPRAIAENPQFSMKIREVKPFEIFIVKQQVYFATPVRNGVVRVFKFNNYNVREALFLSAFCKSCCARESNPTYPFMFDIYINDPKVIFASANSWYRKEVNKDGLFGKIMPHCGETFSDFWIDSHGVVAEPTYAHIKINYERPLLSEVKIHNNNIVMIARKFWSGLYPGLEDSDENVVRCFLLHALF